MSESSRRRVPVKVAFGVVRVVAHVHVSPHMPAVSWIKAHWDPGRVVFGEGRTATTSGGFVSCSSRKSTGMWRGNSPGTTCVVIEMMLWSVTGSSHWCCSLCGSCQSARGGKMRFMSTWRRIFIQNSEKVHLFPEKIGPEGWVVTSSSLQESINWLQATHDAADDDLVAHQVKS